MRFLLKILISLIALLALVAVGGMFFLDGIVKQGIETVGTQTTGVEVTLDDVGLSLLSGKGGLRGLRVANPRGYRAPHAVKVGQALVVLKPLSVFSDRVVIRSVVVQGPEIHYEKRGGKTNLDAIQANVESSLAAKDKRAKSEKKLQIDSFIIRDAKVHLYGDNPDDPPAILALNEIHLKDLGQGTGITGAELTRKLTSAVIKDTLAAPLRGVTQGLKGLFRK